MKDSKKHQPLPSLDRLNELFHCNPDTGYLAWKNRLHKSNPSEIAGYTASNGYCVVSVDGREYKAHRLIWKIAFGADPEAQIDHRNGKKNDNRISNMRLARGAINHRNRRTQKNNTSGIPGVWRHGSGKGWQAGVRVNGVRTYLGTYPTKLEACSARWQWFLKHGEQFGFTEDHFTNPDSLREQAAPAERSH